MPSYPRKKAFPGVDSLVQQTLEKYHLDDAVVLAKLQSCMAEAVGIYFAAHFTAHSFREGKLTLRVDNSEWRHESVMSRVELTKAFSEYTDGKVREIFFL